MKFLQNRVVVIALRWALAAVFIYAGTTKLGTPQNFSDSIASFAILPNSLINILALGLPPFEIIAGLAIFIGIQRRPAIFGLHDRAGISHRPRHLHRLRLLRLRQTFNICCMDCP